MASTHHHMNAVTSAAPLHEWGACGLLRKVPCLVSRLGQSFISADLFTVVDWRVIMLHYTGADSNWKTCYIC